MALGCVTLHARPFEPLHHEDEFGEDRLPITHIFDHGGFYTPKARPGTSNRGPHIRSYG